MYKGPVIKFALLTLLSIGIFLGSTTELQAQKRYRVSYKSEGFSPILEGAFRIPSNIYSTGYGLNRTLGYQYNPYIYAGIGTSLDAYDSDFYLPAFVDVRYFFVDGQFSPYFFVDAGYGFPIDVNEDLGAGLMVNPGVGARYYVTRTVAFVASLGYRYQSMPVDQIDVNGAISTRPNYIQSFTIRLGLQF